MTDFWASPAGGGTGLSFASPTTIGAWMASANCAAGNRLLLLDGTYTGATGMVAAISGHNGTPGNYITVQAINEGNVLIDGQSARIPVKGSGTAATSDYYNLIGINACNSSLDVYQIQRADGWLIQRCGGWDAANKNTYIFVVNYGSGNVFEDCFGFGICRKICLTYGNNGPNTWRRLWSRWCDGETIGPHIGMSLIYNSYGGIFENCLATWDMTYIPVPYTVLDIDGSVYPQTGTVGGVCTGAGFGFGTVVAGTPNFCQVSDRHVQQQYAPIGADGGLGPAEANAKVLGCISYEKVGQILKPPSLATAYLVLMSNVNGIQIKDSVAYYPNNASFGSGHKTLVLGTSTGSSAVNVTSFKGVSDGQTISASWAPTNVVEATTPAALYTNPGETLYNTSQGAQIRYRYQDGTLTSNELWPWPMSARIDAALATTRYAVEDVDGTMQGFFGTFPTVPAAGGGVWFTP